MKTLSRCGIGKDETLFAAGYLTVLMFLLLASDPGWLYWAGPLILGAFPVDPPAIPVAIAPMEEIRAASYAVLPGLLALVFLARLAGDPGRSRSRGVRDGKILPHS